MVSLEKPEQQTHDQIEKSHPQCSPNIAAAQAQVSPRNQRAADQRNQKNCNHQNGERPITAALWGEYFARRLVPRVGRFEVSRFARKRGGFDMESLIGTQGIGAVPGDALVISVLRHPGRRNLLELSKVETCFMKHGGPVNRTRRAWIRFALRWSPDEPMESSIDVEIDHRHARNIQRWIVRRHETTLGVEGARAFPVPESIRTRLFCSQFVPTIRRLVDSRGVF